MAKKPEPETLTIGICGCNLLYHGKLTGEIIRIAPLCLSMVLEEVVIPEDSKVLLVDPRIAVFIDVHTYHPEKAPDTIKFATSLTSFMPGNRGFIDFYGLGPAPVSFLKKSISNIVGSLSLSQFFKFYRAYRSV